MAETPNYVSLRCSDWFLETAKSEKGLRIGKVSIQLMETDDDALVHEMVFTVLP